MCLETDEVAAVLLLDLKCDPNSAKEKKEGLSRYWSQVPHSDAVYHSFCSIKRPEGLLLPPGRMTVYLWQIPSPPLPPLPADSLQPFVLSGGVEWSIVRVMCLAQEHNTVMWTGLEASRPKPQRAKRGATSSP